MTKQAVVDEPLPSVENENNIDEKQSIWASILRDVKSSTKKAPATKSLVVLGDNESGRTTLVAKLQGNDDPKRGAGLEYHYIDIKDDDRDDTPKLGVWILDGDVSCSAPLLKFAIKSETLENTILILVANMTHPWSLLTTLKKWITLVEEHIDRLQIDPTRLREMRDHLQYDFQHYIEPNDSSIMLTSSASSTTIKSSIGGSRIPNSVSSVSLASATALSPTNGDEQVVLPLADGVLTKSLGIPVIVVITKCDVMPTLEKENDYKDEYFDFMQHHLRKFCLEYGAALFYTSVKEKKNIDKLYKYIVHKCYGYPFTSTAAIVERDAIFIPIGWDNPKKADILLENLHRLKSTDNYSDVFVKPVVRRPLQRDNEIITADDDQEFLARLQLTLNRAASPGRADENATPVLTRTSGVSGNVTSQTPSVAGRSRNQPNVTPSGANAAANEGALANFFNSLLTRKSGGAVTPTTAGTPVTQRQTSQSPTTPSSKRLQQHPLTFAVTPPPARARTPTSHKTLPSSLNAESPPKLLSPVVEQQPKIEPTTSGLPTIVGTSVEENEPMKISDITEDKQSSITSDEPLHLNHNEKQSNDALQFEIEPIINKDEQNTESITFQHDSVSNTINNSNTETLNSPTRSSSLIENNSNVAQIALTDDNHRRLSNDFSLSQSITQEQESEITRSPSSQLPVTEVFGNNEQTNNNTSSTTQSRPSSPVINDNNKLIDQSPSADHNSPRLLSSPTSENAQKLNNREDNEKRTFPVVVSQEETPKSPIEDLSSNNNNEEQQDGSKQSLNSSRRNSLMNASIPPRPLSPVSNEPQQQEEKTLLSPIDIIQTLPGDDAEGHHSESELPNETVRSEQLDRRSSSSDVRESETPIRSRPMSPKTLETSELSSTDQEQNNSLLSHTEQAGNTSIPTEVPGEDSLTIQSPRLLSTSNVNTSEEEQQDQMLIPLSNTNNNQNHRHSPIEMFDNNPILHSTENINSSAVIENHNLVKSPISEHPPSSPINDQQRDSPFIEDNLQRSPTHETSLSHFSIPQNPESTKLAGSPTLESGDIKSDFYENTTPLPITEEKYQRSRSPSPNTKQEQQRSRPVSPVTEQEQVRSRTPSPMNEQEQQRSQSPLSMNEQKWQRDRPSSPTTDHNQRRSRSPSPINAQEQQRCRSPSPIIEHKEQRSPSLSFTIEQKEERSRSSSLLNEEKQERSRSTSPTSEQKHEQNSPALPVIGQNPERSRSPSLNNENNQQSSRSPSPNMEQDSQRKQSTSVAIEQKQERSRSPSPSSTQKRERSRSSSPVFEEKQERSQSPLPSAEQNQQKSRSPSLSIEQDQERSQSSPLQTEQKEERSESLTSLPLNEQNKQRSRSSSFTSQQEQQPNQTASPTNEQKQQRSQSSSSIHEYQRKDSFSIEPIENKLDSTENESSLPRTSSNQEIETQSTSKVVSSPIVDNQQEQQSDTLTSSINEDQRKYSLTQINENALDSTSPKVLLSPVVLSPKSEEKKSPQLSTDVNYETTHNLKENAAPSPIVDSKQQVRSRSPSPTISEKHNQNNENEITSATPLSPKNENELFEKEEYKSEETNKNGQILINSDEQLKKSPLSSPLIDKRIEEPLLVPSPTNQQETSFIKTKNKNQISPLSHSSPLIEPIPSTQHSSSDHHNESHPSSIPKLPDVFQSSITRSQSQSTLTRPNTLRFSPNNDDLGGVYMSNEYNDEDEVPEGNEYHHNSAPSTVNVEYRRSSLIHDNGIEQRHTPIDPHDILKRLSIVEKSRMEDNDNTSVDSTNSKAT